MRPLFLRILGGLFVVVASSHLISVGIWWSRFDAEASAALRQFVDHANAEFVAALDDGVALDDDEAVDRLAEGYGLAAHAVPPPPPGGPPGDPPGPPRRGLERHVEHQGHHWLVRPRLPGPHPPHPPAVIGQIVVILLAVAAVTWWLAAPLVRELSQLEETVGKLGREELGARARVPEGGPTRTLAQGINRMAERVQTLVRGQRQLFQAVSHEIRTPHARIRFRLEALGEAPEPERAGLIEAIDRDLSEVDALVEELIQYLRYDIDQPRPDSEPWALGDALRDAADQARPLDSEIAVEVGEPEGPFEVAITRKWLVRAVLNLVTNAQRHANKTVRISAGRRDGAAVIDVDDDGPGIAPEDRQRLLEPFATGDVSRSRATGGVGLGLAIVARIAARTGGELLIGDSPLGGARVSLSWPIAAPIF